VVFKSFLDGGNQADSRIYDVVSLASVSGTPTQWRSFEHEWNAVLKKHSAPFLHTTDAVSLKNEPFTKENGWDKPKRDSFLSDCVSVIESHIARPAQHSYSNPRDGLIPYVLTVVLKDFNRARETNSKVPRNANVLCATQVFDRVLKQGGRLGADFAHLTFDQTEPFMGHILDRKQNKKARKALGTIMDRATITSTNMRLTPGLQAADLFAWCFSHKLQKPRHRWQNRLLNHRKWIDEWLEYDQLIKVIPGVPEIVASWNLPPRRPTR
jgi:hypothetical protein